MATPARHSSTRPSTTTTSAFGGNRHYTLGEVHPDERIGGPRIAGGTSGLRLGVVALLALGGGFALLGDRVQWLQSLWPQSPAVETTAAPLSTDRAAPGPVAFDPSALAQQTPDAGAAAIPPVPTIERAVPSAASAPAAAVSYAPPAPSLRTPSTAAYQERASAAGLHPDLSHILLARLSPTDYRNAGIAIQTAIAETPDAGVFVWPRQRKPELALFQVRFVAGAATGCRRYVVEITKDGWLTTALPMEKCRPQRG